jgi:peptidoglycan hydrolase CwlO-like protein
MQSQFNNLRTLSEELQAMLNSLTKRQIQLKSKITQLLKNLWMTLCTMKNVEDML